MTTLEIAYRLELLSPLHISTGTGFANMIDDVIVRAGPALGAGSRLPCVPGSSIKGKIRSRCEALANMLALPMCNHTICKDNLCVRCRLFGSSFTSGTLKFANAVLDSDWHWIGHNLEETSEPGQPRADSFTLSTPRTGNKVERATRTVEPHFLFTHEQSAEGLQFNGSISGYIETRSLPGFNLALPVEGWLLITSLMAVDKIGGLRSRGLGRCKVSITQLSIDAGNDVAHLLSDLLAHEDFLYGLSEYAEL